MKKKSQTVQRKIDCANVTIAAINQWIESRFYFFHTCNIIFRIGKRQQRRRLQLQSESALLKSTLKKKYAVSCASRWDLAVAKAVVAASALALA